MNQPPAPHDPFGWLVDLITEAWGDAKITPASTPTSRASRSDPDGLIWYQEDDGRRRRAWAWFTPDGRTAYLIVTKGAEWKAALGDSTGNRLEMATLGESWDGWDQTSIEPLARSLMRLPDPPEPS